MPSRPCLSSPPAASLWACLRRAFRSPATRAAGKREHLELYFIAGHPGCDLGATIELALFLKRHKLRPDKVQEFMPGPMDIATCMYYTGIDPLTGEPVHVPRNRERRLQKALLHYYKPENYADVRKALEQAGRQDLIGSGPNCLIPSRPPQGARKKNRPDRQRSKKPTPKGYRPGRKTAKRRK